MKQRGFTLIELLVAMAVFAVLAMLAYGGLNTMLYSRSQSEEHADALRELQLAYRLVERDIEQLVRREIRDEFGATRAALSAGGQIDSQLELTRGGWRNPAEQQRSTLQRVAYAVRDEQLVRLNWLNLDRAASDLPVTQELLGGVRELRLRFLDTSNVWQDQWPAAGVQPGAEAGLLPPRALEWIIVTERWGELRWLFRLPG